MPIIRLLALSGAIVMAYYWAAQWLLHFSLPPIDVAPLWISAGIAAGAVLVWGYALLPAAFIGAFAVGFALAGWHVALLMGAQAVLHAFMVRYLFAVSSRWPNPLMTDADIPRFFLLSGVIASLPPATFIVAVKLWCGQLSAEIAFNHFLMWTVSGALGVILLAPVMLILFAAPRDIWRARLKSVALPLLLMLAVLILVLFQTSHQEQQVKKQRFFASVGVTHALLTYELDLHQFLLRSMRSYFLHSDYVSAEEFSAYIQELDEHHHAIQASMWIVSETMGEGPFYLQYLEVLKPENEAYTQLDRDDICKTPADYLRCLQVVQQPEQLFIYPAFESLQASFSDKLMLTQAIQDVTGVQNGIVAHLLDYQRLFSDLSESATHQWVVFRVTDAISGAELFSSENFSADNRALMANRLLNLSDTVQWQLDYQPSPAFFDAHQTQAIPILMLAALLLTGVIATWLFSNNSRVFQIQRAVREKTHALEQHMKLLTQSETKYRQLIENIQDEYVIYSRDLTSQLTYISPSVENILGHTCQEMLGHYSKYMPDSELNRQVSKLTEQTLSGKTMAYEVEMIDKQGQIHVMAVREMPSRDDDSNLVGVDGIMRDMTEYHETLLTLKKLSLAVRHSPNAIIITDKNRQIEYVNPKFTAITGFSAAEATGCWPTLTRPAPDQEKLNVTLWETVLMGQEWRGEMPNFKKSGEVYWAQELIAPMLNESGDVTHVVITQVDITEARRLNEETTYQASHDLLTGLINRREFDLRLKRVIESSKKDKSEHALCFMDLDQFKVINDTCGHIAGDEMLRQVGRLLQANIRVRDTIARLGGDEFVILMEHCSIEQAYSACENVITLFEDFRFHWEGYTFTIGASMGLTVIDFHTKDHIEAMRNVDNACYAAKDSGRNRVEVHTDDSARLQQRRGEIQWSAEISEALDEDRFVLFAQPIQAIRNPRAGLGYEILLRLRRRDGRLSPPSAFLPAAERYNSINRLDRWVVSKTLDWLDEHAEQLEHVASVSINLSGLTLSDQTLLGFIGDRLRQAIFPTSKIKFEITETAAIANLSAATYFIETLKSMGVGFALDDFGSGLSSFAYLKKMQVDALKIDGMFVKDMLTDPLDFEMVKSINEIGHVMGLETIAEFVEGPEILVKLREIGVDYAQGYGIGRPEPIERMLKKSRA